MDKKQHPEAFGSLNHDAGAKLPDDAHVVEALGGLNSDLANTGRELESRNAGLGNVIREKNQLLGMAVHDLRNPLGIIVGIAELLTVELGASLSAENFELFSHVATEAAYMAGLIDDLLDYTKIDAGRLDLELHAVAVTELIRENVAFNSIIANKKGIKLRLECEEPIPPLNLDSRRFQQVLNNLISNALKFSHSGTTITISLSCKQAEVTMAIADEGQGIATDELGKLFKPFSSTRTRSTANEKSTGLGLAIVRRIIAAHGGRIRVESEIGRGSVFYVTLPVAPSVAGEFRLL